MLSLSDTNATTPVASKPEGKDTMTQIPLERKGNEIDWQGIRSFVEWFKGLPFAAAKSGILVHRVRSARSHIRFSRHDSADFLCGQTACSPVFMDDPGDRLVCQRCELIANHRGLPSADRIVGRHVHVGRLRAERLCCNDNSN